VGEGRGGQPAAFVSVVTEPGQRDDVAAALSAVEIDMEPARRAERARMVVEAARAASAAPLSARQQLLTAVPADRFDSIAVSNLGAVDDPPTFGAPGGELWVSAPAVPQAGISVVVITTGDELRITTAYRRERFDDDGALAFTDALAGCLLGG
jgi:hypothetical protein